MFFFLVLVSSSFDDYPNIKKFAGKINQNLQTVQSAISLHDVISNLMIKSHSKGEPKDSILQIAEKYGVLLPTEFSSSSDKIDDSNAKLHQIEIVGSIETINDQEDDEAKLRRNRIYESIISFVARGEDEIDEVSQVQYDPSAPSFVGSVGLLSQSHENKLLDTYVTENQNSVLRQIGIVDPNKSIDNMNEHEKAKLRRNRIYESIISCVARGEDKTDTVQQDQYDPKPLSFAFGGNHTLAPRKLRFNSWSTSNINENDASEQNQIKYSSNSSVAGSDSSSSQKQQKITIKLKKDDLFGSCSFTSTNATTDVHENNDTDADVESFSDEIVDDNRSVKLPLLELTPSRRSLRIHERINSTISEESSETSYRAQRKHYQAAKATRLSDSSSA